MKINEITEGLLDNLKGKLGRYRNTQAIDQAANLAVTAWKKKLQSLEAMNDYNELQSGLLKKHLRAWIDQSLLGKYSLDTAPTQFQQSVNSFVGQIASAPKDNVVLKKAFGAIMNQSTKLALQDISGQQQTQQKQTTGGKTLCQEPPKVDQGTGTMTICGQTVKTSDLPQEFLDKIEKLS